MKNFQAFGVASKNYATAQQAADDTYTTSDGVLEPTPLVFPDNPFNDDVQKAKIVFEIGFGIGRNVKWIMENTTADYYGVEPNPTMYDNFWEFNDKQYEKRIHIYRSFEEMPKIKIDVVVSTFVLQHIAYMPAPEIMNAGDILTQIRQYANAKTVWILLEHDSEQLGWIEHMFSELQIEPTVYQRAYTGIESMTHRDFTTHTGHHLVIWKGK